MDASSPVGLYILSTVLIITATLATALRFQARRIKKATPSWDDWLIVLALVRPYHQNPSLTLYKPH